MTRPRNDERHPLKRLLQSVRRGEGVLPEHQAHVEAVIREAEREASEHGFSVFELMAAAMAARLYVRSLEAQEQIVLARCLGETIRALRSLKLLEVEGRLRGRTGMFGTPRGKRGSPFTAPRPVAAEVAVVAGDEQDDGE